MKHFLGQMLKPDLILLAHNSEPPGDEEWQQALAIASKCTTTQPFRCLVITDGGSPTLRQRKALDERLRAVLGGKTAIVTDSSATRAVLAAVGWLSRNKLKAFGGSELPEAIQWLGVDKEDEALLKSAMVRASTALHLNIYSYKSRVSA